ncbi:septation protein IspZ [Erythrobacteraceae bacterium CFH 75059]|uniref:inner membrane-spanning protein YciB n=1 Tax=Qipengyuania thermophila TaxID=2509361 RepID=UPI001020F0D3|nr:inner membrane-spanning protein YciB [Qipengyuania thermophila]TCD05032.1 septation protein IspZ [Erythrobacteraceae bacterium CFH 75059]
MTGERSGRRPSGCLNILVDYGPLLVFLGVYKLYSGGDGGTVAEVAAVVRGTLAFMVAALAALAFSRWRFGRVSPMLWLSTGLIVVFGALTVWLRDERFIQLKPTVIYLLFAAALLIGWWRGKALLKILLEAAFEGLSAKGWLTLSRNWGVFFIVLAGVNEGLRAFASFETWLWAKLWVFLPLSLAFTVSQMPMLLRHGLAVDEPREPLEDQPPTG